ncbi:MAG: phage tail tape measure protein [Prevotella sp.]|jgi:TP901 family phage tail tape measure protein|nr:phage tail tape measure protein [Prevotella sp.]
MAKDVIKQGIVLTATDKASKVLADFHSHMERSAKAMVGFKLASDAMMSVTNKIAEIASVGANFEEQMAEVQMVTRLSESEMKNVGDEARRLAKTFGVDAAAGVETFGGFIAQLGSGVASNQDALASLGNSAFTLSKSMKNDVTGAMDALATSLIQFKVDINDGTKAASEAARMMNVLAAGGNAGKAEVNDLAASFKEAGAIFNMSNVSFEEATGVLETLSLTMGQTGAEAGTAMRNIMLAMSTIDNAGKKALTRLDHLGVDLTKVKNKSIPLVARLTELKKIVKDDTAMTLLFDKANVGAAKNIIENTDLLRDLTKQVTGTTDAVDNATIRMDTYTEAMKRHQAKIDDIKISFFDLMGDAAPWFTMVAEGSGSVLDMAGDIGMLSFALKGVNLEWLKAGGAIAVAATATAGIVAAGWEYFPDFRADVKQSGKTLKDFAGVAIWFTYSVIARLLSSVGNLGNGFKSLFSFKFGAAADYGTKALKDLGGIGHNSVIAGAESWKVISNMSYENDKARNLEHAVQLTKAPKIKPIDVSFHSGMSSASPGISGNIEYKPTININGGNINKAEVKQVLDDEYERFAAYMDKYKRDQMRLSYE